MSAIAFPRYCKTLTLSSGVVYSYVFSSAKIAKPTLLFLHGFPSSCYDWRHQIPHFLAQGYGIIAPDLLGYGGTDKPTDPAAYRGKKMASEVVEILDHENILKVHGIGHDWGSYLLSKIVDYHGDRVLSLSFLDLPYMPPQQVIDVDVINASTKRVMGFEIFGYWKFFEKPEAAKLVGEHFDSFFSLLHSADMEDIKNHFAALGALEASLSADKQVPMGSYITASEKEIHHQIFQGKYGPAMNWYIAKMHNINAEDEALLDPEPKLPCPVLMVGASRDPIGNKENAQTIAAFTDNLMYKEVVAGHWLQLEKPNEVNSILDTFFMGLINMS